MSDHIGADEVGRGALAGPLVACAVFITNEKTFPYDTVTDSKLMTDQERRELVPALQENCQYAYGIVSHVLIDRLGIQPANVLAIELALRIFPASTPVRADYIGGFKTYASSLRNIEFFTHGESKFPEIAAASILAKVFRDDLMIAMNAQYPGYAFDKHKGYGTENHYACLNKYGLLSVHRRSFVKV